VSEHTRADLIATLDVDATKIEVIRHGARPEDYQFDSKELTELRTQIKVEAGPMILCVSRLEPRKGIDVLLRAFEQVVREIRATLVLVGAGPQEYYRVLAEELGIDQRVVFMGHVDTLSLRKLYAACDIFAFPSLLEGLGLVVLEARAAGKFIVASQVGGVPEVVPAGAGYLVPPGDVAALADALMKALSEPHTELPPVPTWEEAGLQLCKVYEEAVS